MSRVSLANHAHVFPESINAKGTIPRLLSLMDACDIHRAVTFAPFSPLCDVAGIKPNQWLASQLKQHPDRLLGFGTVDPRLPNIPSQVREIADLGLKGIKFHPNGQSMPILSPQSRELYQAASDANLFLTIHTGVHQSRLKDVRVIDFDEVAWDYPNLKFSLEHVGGYHFFHEAVAVIFNHLPTPWNPSKQPNVFAGLTSIFTPDHLPFWHQSKERLLTLIQQVGPSQLIFGLDFPYNLEPQTQTALTVIDSLGLSPEDKQKVLGGNLQHALGLS